MRLLAALILTLMPTAAVAMPPVPGPNADGGYDLVSHASGYDVLVLASAHPDAGLLREMRASTEGHRMEGHREVPISVVQYLGPVPVGGIDTVQWDFGSNYYGGGLGLDPGSTYLLALSRDQQGRYTTVAHLSSRLDRLKCEKHVVVVVAPTSELQSVLRAKEQQNARLRRSQVPELDHRGNARVVWWDTIPASEELERQVNGLRAALKVAKIAFEEYGAPKMAVCGVFVRPEHYHRSVEVVETALPSPHPQLHPSWESVEERSTAADGLSEE